MKWDYKMCELTVNNIIQTFFISRSFHLWDLSIFITFASISFKQYSNFI